MRGQPGTPGTRALLPPPPHIPREGRLQARAQRQVRAPFPAARVPSSAHLRFGGRGALGAPGPRQGPARSTGIQVGTGALTWLAPQLAAPRALWLTRVPAPGRVGHAGLFLLRSSARTEPGELARPGLSFPARRTEGSCGHSRPPSPSPSALWKVTQGWRLPGRTRGSRLDGTLGQPSLPRGQGHLGLHR